MGTDTRIATTSLPDPASPATPNLKRRRFLLAIGAGGAAVATAAADAASVVVPASTDLPQTENTASTYRATEHVRDYYRTTRI
jgi:hypothetical protein